MGRSMPRPPDSSPPPEALPRLDLQGLQGAAPPSFGLGECPENDEPALRPRQMSAEGRGQQPRSPRNKISQAAMSPPAGACGAQDLEALLSRMLREHALEMREVIREELAGAPGRDSLPSSEPPDVRRRVHSRESHVDRPVNQTATFTTEEQQSQLRALEEEAVGTEDALDYTKSIMSVVAAKAPVLRSCIKWAESKRNAFGKSYPHREDCVSRFVHSAQFHLLVYLVIIVNVAFMVYSADYEVQNYDAEATAGHMRIIEGLFMGFYSVELALRLWKDGRYFWIEAEWKWNWLDTFLVMVSYYIYFLAEMLPNVSWLRLLKLMKLTKVLRVFRVVSMFKTLRAILMSLISTISTLFWSLVMLYIIIFMFALCFTLIAGNYFADQQASLDPGTREELMAYFGSVNQSSISLYMCITGGNDWALFYNALAPTGNMAKALFLFFVFFTQVAVMNIILGMFVNQAIDHMQPTREEAAEEHVDVMRMRDRDLRAIIQLADIAGDGVISIEEWRETLKKGNVAAYLDLCGFRANDLQEYYKMMCKETADGKVDLKNFMEGCLSLRGGASRFDTHVLHSEMKDLSALVRQILEK